MVSGVKQNRSLLTYNYREEKYIYVCEKVSRAL